MDNRVVLPYSMGAYLAVSALPDSRLVVDGPTCAFYRTDVIQGNHDLMADLLDVTGRHRVLNTFAEPDNVVVARGELLVQLLRGCLGDPDVGATFLLAFPMSYLTGVPYDGLVRRARGEGGGLVLPLPRVSLRHRWLQGYADSLEALATALPLGEGARSPDKVAVVGYLMDRNEGDHLGNMAELERLLGALGLETVSIWLSGRPTASLARAAEAGTIVSLPHGRDAARTLAGRTGARLVELPLPIGVHGSAAWLRSLARALDREEAAETFVAREHERVARRLRWAAGHVFQAGRFALVAEPHVGAGLAAFLRELGGEVLALYPTDLVATGDEAEVSDASLDRIAADLTAFGEEAPVDLVVSPALHLGVAQALRLPFLEFGFPCHTEHAFHARPYLGFEGALVFAEQVYNRVQLHRYATA